MLSGSFKRDGLTEQEIRVIITNEIPNISNSDLWNIRNKFVYENIPLEVSIYRYKREKQVDEWNKRKDKHYYKVPMLNGGHKYVFMCEEMVKDFYGNYGYELIG